MVKHMFLRNDDNAYGVCALVKRNGTIRFLDHKNTDLDTKIIILSALVQKLWSKMYFCKMMVNVIGLRVSRITSTWGIFFYKDLHFDYHPHWHSGSNQSVGSSVPVVSRWL